MEFDLNALQELPAQEEQAGYCGQSCTGTCPATCPATGLW
ncbi:ALQxL family class IV lanthipeptide [Kutzneria sp. 744]|nr:ALQxL family class IV lanthipeptide [Kutzneria sp. 744]